MKLMVQGNAVHASTGGRPHVEGRPFILFLHGSGFSHLSWVLQTRALAYDGWNVIAPDLPGHFRSGGKPLETIEAMADWSLAILDACGAKQAVIAGHSMGGLIALELARKAPQRVRALVLCATALEIPVNAKLIETAEAKEPVAFASMVSWAHGSQAHLHENTWPGASHVFFSIETMGRNAMGTLAVDLKACAAYRGGGEAAGAIQVPALCILAKQDRMTPIGNGRKMAAALAGSTVLELDCGHTLMTEKPRETNAAIRAFLDKTINARAAA
ncbi:MAG: alpha/beta hydrolase [Rhizobiaceae bacterium]